ncbi:MAG: CopG family transcriptional regulator [bacterium]|nr:CopG family transcriptional regulator [bacterium]
MLTVALDSDIERRLEALGASTESSKTAWLKKAVLGALEEMEDLRMAEERLARPEREWTHDEVKKNLGLDDQMAG